MAGTASNRSTKVLLNKNLTLIRLTLKQLLLSRLNAGIIILIMIPWLIAGLYASDVFKETTSQTQIERISEPFPPQEEEYYFEDTSPSTNITVNAPQILYQYNENKFTFEITGMAGEEIDHIDLQIIYYYSFQNWQKILQQYTDEIDIQPLMQNAIRSADPGAYGKLFVSWDYSDSDDSNWTNATNRFYGFYGESKNLIESQDFKLRLNRLNALPFLIESEGFIFQFGTVNLSASETGIGYEWSDWRLVLEFGKLDYILAENASSPMTDYISRSMLKELEATQLYWPNQITIFINGYEVEPSSNNRTQIAQVHFTETIAKRTVVETSTESDEQGHVAFINAGGALYLMFIIPIISMLYISMAVSDDRENRTLTYLFSRPVSKHNILSCKILSAYTAAFITLAPSMAITYFIMSGYKNGMHVAIDNIGILGVFMGILVLGLFIYSSVFALFGSLLKHPLIIGLTYIFFFDQLISNLPFHINRVSIGYHLTTISYHNLSNYTSISVYDPLSSWQSGAILCAAAVILLIFAALFYSEKDAP